MSRLRVSMLIATTSKGLAAELRLERVERRHLLAARHAPRGPEVQQHRAAAEIAIACAAAIGVVEGKIGQPLRLGRDADRRDLTARQRRKALGQLRGRAADGVRIALHRADPVYRREPDRDARKAAKQRPWRAGAWQSVSGRTGRSSDWRSGHEQQDVGRAFCVWSRRHHAGDQRLDRLRSPPLPPGHRGKQGPCGDAREAGHHLARRCPRDRSRSRHDPVRDGNGQVPLQARARRHPYERRSRGSRS